MASTHAVAFVLLASALGLGACSAPPAEAQSTKSSTAATPLDEAGAVKSLVETRWPSRVRAGAAAPSFVVDASWPKPLPHNWRIGQVGGIAVDSHDHIWVYHRPRTLDASSAGALPRVATNAQGMPINALGHPRPYADRSTGCCATIRMCSSSRPTARSSTRSATPERRVPTARRSAAGRTARRNLISRRT